MCPRCRSEEIYPTPSRRLLVLRGTTAIVLSPGAAYIPHPIGSALMFGIWFTALVYVVSNLLVPRMQCRSCGAEWRGKSRNAGVPAG